MTRPRKPKHPQKFRAALLIELVTPDTGIEPDSVLAALSEEIEREALWAGDSDHDDESGYQVRVVGAEVVEEPAPARKRARARIAVVDAGSQL